MHCSEVRERLVAWRDGELGRSEQTQVEAHLLSCPACTELDRKLARSRPRPSGLVPPPEIRARLARDLDTDRILALADQPTPAPWGLVRAWSAARHQLGRPLPVTRGAALAYLILLAGVFGWGLSSWWSTRPTGSTPTAASGEIPADQFRPASYEPGRTPAPRP